MQQEKDFGKDPLLVLLLLTNHQSSMGALLARLIRLMASPFVTKRHTLYSDKDDNDKDDNDEETTATSGSILMSSTTRNVDSSTILTNDNANQQQPDDANQQQQPDDKPDDANRMIYLNHAGQAPWSEITQQAGLDAVTRPPWDAVAAANQASAECRGLFAQLLVGSAESVAAESSSSSSLPIQDCIALMPSTAFAMTLAAHNLVRLRRQQPQDSNQPKRKYKVLLLQDQYPSAVYPWQEMCDQYPEEWSIHVVPYPEEEEQQSEQQQQDKSSSNTTTTTWTDVILKHLAQDPDIAVVSLPPLHWADGRLIDLERIATAIRRRNALAQAESNTNSNTQRQPHSIDIIVDATQAVGIYPLYDDKDNTHNILTTVRPTLVACSAHKWLRGPSGVCCCYVAPRAHSSWQPLDQHERARNVDGALLLAGRHGMDSHTGYYPSEFVPGARKFDSGGKANPLLLPMLAAALRQVVEQCQETSLSQQQRQLRQLMTPLIQWCREHGWVVRDHVVEPNDNDTDANHSPLTLYRAYHLVGIEPPAAWNLTPAQLVQLCQYDLYQERRIIVAPRCGGLRISPSVVTTPPSHIAALLRALEAVQEKYSSR